MKKMIKNRMGCPQGGKVAMTWITNKKSFECSRSKFRRGDMLWDNVMQPKPRAQVEKSGIELKFLKGNHTTQLRR